MTPLYEALECIAPGNKPGVIKYLKAAEIKSWEDIDKPHLVRFAEEVKRSVAPSSAHTTFAVFKSFLGRHEDEIKLPKDWRDLLEARNELPMKTYLTAEEVEAFGEVSVKSDLEQTVRDGFYVSCKTGLRHSDLVKLRQSNFQRREDGGFYLNYVSKKTKIRATIPCSKNTVGKVAWLTEHGVETTLVNYNKTVRKLAKRAGITGEVVVFKAGKELAGPKFRFLSSHSARVSFCTILADLGTSVVDIMRLAGHTNPEQTSHYLVRHAVMVNNDVEKFLM